jgi:hypothetical protein
MNEMKNKNKNNLRNPRTLRMPTLNFKTTSKPTLSRNIKPREKFTEVEFDFLGELKNACVKIPLFQAIKDVPVYSKAVQELCLRKTNRK